MKTAGLRKSVSDFFVSRGLLFVLIPLLSFAVWYYPLANVNAVRSEEQLNFFIVGYTYNDDGLDADLLDDDGLKKQGLYEVNISFYSPTETYLSSYYEAFGKSSEFLILPESDLDEMFKDELEGVLETFYPWDKEVKALAGCASSDTFYALPESGLEYALKLTSEAFPNIGGLADFQNAEGEGSAYLLLNRNTPNWGVLSDGSLTSLATSALPMFLERYR